MKRFILPLLLAAIVGLNFIAHVSAGGPQQLLLALSPSNGASSSSSGSGSSSGSSSSSGSGSSTSGGSGSSTSGGGSGAGIAVSGNHLVNASTGQTVTLFGVNVSGMEGHQNSWNTIAQVTTAQWAALASKWGFNVLRFPLNSAYWLNHTVYDDPAEPGGGSCCYTSIGTNEYTPDPSGTYQSALQTIVANVTAAGIVVDFDLHWDAPKNNAGNAIAPIGQPSFAGSDYAPTFWTQLANTFKGNPLVMFELFNEPFGSNTFGNMVTGSPFVPATDAIKEIEGGSFSNFKMQNNAASNAIFTLQGCNPCGVAGMTGLLSTIRGTGATNVVLGSPINYAGEIEVWPAMYTNTTYGAPVNGNPDPLKQFGAAWHDYGWGGSGNPNNSGPSWPLAVLSDGYPIVITETYGFDSSFDGGKNVNMYTWANTNNVSVLLWAWATWSSGGATTGTALYNYWLNNAPWELGSATAPPGNTFGASPIASGAPAQASAVGYNTLTFNNSTLGTSTGTWQACNFYGGNNSGYTNTQNSDGSFTMTGGGNSSCDVQTAKQTSSSPYWSGVAFGGGMYAEATISFTGQTNYSFPNGGWAFWMLDVEHTSQGPYSVGWPAGAHAAWSSTTTYAQSAIVAYSGQLWISLNGGNLNNPPPNAGTQSNAYWNLYNDFFEVDNVEWDSANSSYPTAYQNGIGNWYGNKPLFGNTESTGNPGTPCVSGSVGSVCVASGTNFATPHKYGVLWVPATGSGTTTTTQGYLKFYFDGVQTGTTFYWNYYNPTNGAYPAPPPVNGSTAMSGMDFRHMFLMLGSDVNQPTRVYSVKVWQTSAANNLVN